MRVTKYTVIAIVVPSASTRPTSRSVGLSANPGRSSCRAHSPHKHANANAAPNQAKRGGRSTAAITMCTVKKAANGFSTPPVRYSSTNRSTVSSSITPSWMRAALVWFRYGLPW